MGAAVDTKVRAIITGATGMVGEGVLHECLLSPQVEAVLIVNRSPSGVVHPKLKEIILKDFMKFDALAADMAGYNACFFCLGVSSVGISNDDYFNMTYTLTLGVAKVLSSVNPGMVFCYVSGAGTDSAEKSRRHWVRVKGKTENDLMKLPFKQVYAFRPGFMKATPGLKRVLPLYQYVSWYYPVGKALFPGTVSTLAEVGQAMIRTVTLGYEKQILEVKDIVALAGRGIQNIE
jgi:hypothetical protein